MNEPARGRSVRFRLLAIALLPMLVILPLLLGVAIYRWNTRFDATLISKVHGDLTIAHQYLARILEKTGVQIRALGLSARFRDVEEHDPLSAVSDLLETSRKEIGLDFLYLMDAGGKILASSPAFPGRPKSDWPIIASALSGEAPSPASTSLAMTSLQRFRQRWPNVPVSTWCRRQMPSRPIAARKPTAWSCMRRAGRRPPGARRRRWSAAFCSIRISSSSIRSMTSSISRPACRRAARERRRCSWTTCGFRPMSGCSRAAARSARACRRPCAQRSGRGAHLARQRLRRQ